MKCKLSRCDGENFYNDVCYKHYKKYYNKNIRGVSLFDDINRLIKNNKIEIIFDVGSNIGNYTKECLRWCPKAYIYCFEPTKLVYERLEKEFADKCNVWCNNVAVSNIIGLGKLVYSDNHAMNFFTFEDVGSALYEARYSITLTSFCKKNNIKKINLLKIDTEGSDFNVLKGAIWLLKLQMIDIVQIEVGLNKYNSKHINLSIIQNFMEEYNYRLFGIYNQTGEWTKYQINLRYCDAVFISDALIKKEKESYTYKNKKWL